MKINVYDWKTSAQKQYSVSWIAMWSEWRRKGVAQGQNYESLHGIRPNDMSEPRDLKIYDI